MRFPFFTVGFIWHCKRFNDSHFSDISTSFLGYSKDFLYLAARMYEQNAKAGKLEFKNNFYLQRGDYDLATVLEESVSDEPFTVEGCLIDLFDPKLPIYTSKRINPGEQALLLNVERVAGKKKPQVLASASREEQEERGKGRYSYVAKSPAETSNVSRVLLPRCPKSVTVDGREVFDAKRWHVASHTYLIEFENNPDGVSVKFCW